METWVIAHVRRRVYQPNACGLVSSTSCTLRFVNFSQPPLSHCYFVKQNGWTRAHGRRRPGVMDVWKGCEDRTLCVCVLFQMSTHFLHKSERAFIKWVSLLLLLWLLLSSSGVKLSVAGVKFTPDNESSGIWRIFHSIQLAIDFIPFHSFIWLTEFNSTPHSSWGSLFAGIGAVRKVTMMRMMMTHSLG